MASILRDSVVAVVVCTRQRVTPLGLVTTRKSIRGFPLLSYMGMGHRLVGLRAAGARLKQNNNNNNNDDDDDDDDDDDGDDDDDDDDDGDDDGDDDDDDLLPPFLQVFFTIYSLISLPYQASPYAYDAKK